MKMHILLISLGICLWLPLSLAAQSVEASVDDLLQITGTSDQLSNVAASITSLYAQQEKSFDKDSYQALMKIIGNQFSAEVLSGAVKSELVASFDKALYQKLKATYQKQLIIDITKAEVLHSTSDEQAKIDSFDYDSLPSARKKLLEDFMKSSDELHTLEILTTSGLQAFVTTFNLFLPDEHKIKPEQMKQVIDNSIRQMRSPEYLLHLKKAHALCYASFNDKQMAEYIQTVYGSPEGKWMLKSFYSGLTKGFQTSMRNAADEIKSTFKIQESNT